MMVTADYELDWVNKWGEKHIHRIERAGAIQPKYHM
jgi:hypothetical protein